ncbi:MAG: glucose 1-dehydrogenase [Caulobacter sp.]|jgi:NAD(P)-dependent dehydrogenase (short-subunit alcohol dehydrogenase family)|nr:glucose 1-dehydrogenase [Caulobacter sp.]
MRRLEDRAALVTGAAQGIGAAIAERLVAEGARVLLCDIAPSVAETATRLGQPWRVIDAARQDQVEAAVAFALASFGRLDILVNNAGVTHAAPLLEVTEADFDRVMAVNVKSMLFATQAAARAMIPRGSGAIVNLSSINAVLAIPDQVSYCVSKGAVRQLTNVSAQALAPHGIRVNAIGPGTVMTDMARQAMAATPGADERLLSRTPLGRAGEPSEIAAVAAFLASDDAAYMTGQTLYPDGGRLGLNYLVDRNPRP